MSADIQSRRSEIIRVEGNAVGSALVLGNENVITNVVTIVYGRDFQREALSAEAIGDNPYRALKNFDETSAHLFFGRERLVERLCDRIKQLTAPVSSPAVCRLLGVLGPSGCGKSSVALAGLMPALAGSHVPWLCDAVVLAMRPGSSPIESLANALGRLATREATATEVQRNFANRLRETSGSHDGLRHLLHSINLSDRVVIILVDQFEEVYTLCRPLNLDNDDQVRSTKTERDLFVKQIVGAASDPASRVCVVLTLRSDYYGALVEHAALSKAIASSHEIVPAMDRSDLRRAITEPARLSGWPLSEDVVDRILSDTEDARANALPLVQFALYRIWEGMRLGLNPSSTLNQLGGVGGALASRADELMTSLPSPKAAELAQRAFLSTIQVLDALRETRRRGWLDEVLPVGIGMEEAQAVLERFYKERLLVTGADDAGRVWLELPHESVIKHWQRLRSWVDERRDDLRFSAQVQEVAARWNFAKRPRGSLWRSPDLDLLQRYATRNSLTSLQTVFLSASVRQVVLETWSLRAGIAAFVCLLVLVTTFAWQSHKNARALSVTTDSLVYQFAQTLQSTDGVKLSAIVRTLDGANKLFSDLITLFPYDKNLRERRAGILLEFAKVYLAKENFELASKAASEAESLLRNSDSDDKHKFIPNLARAIIVRGDSQFGLGNLKDAKSAYNEAQDLTQKLEQGRKDEEAVYVAALASTKLGDVSERQGDQDSAVRNYDRCIRNLRPIATELNRKRDLSICYEKKGDLAVNKEDYAQAKSLYQLSLDLAKEIGEKGQGLVGRPGDLPRILAKSGDALANEDKGGSSEGTARLRTAVDQLLALSDPDRLQFSRATAQVYTQLGNAQDRAGDIEGAVSSSRESLRRAKINLVESGNNSDDLEDAAKAGTKLAEILLRRSRAEDVREAVAASGDAERWLGDLGHRREVPPQLIVHLYQCYLGALNRAADFELGLIKAEEYLAVVQRVHDAKSGGYVASAEGWISWFALLTRRFDMALKYADLGSQGASEQKLWILMNRAHALMFLGRLEEARKIYLGEPLLDRDRDEWQKSILKDFDTFDKNGLKSVLLAEIRMKMAATGGSEHGATTK
jgi:hypothetical protein